MPFKRRRRRRRRRRTRGAKSVGKKLLSDARRRGTNSKLEKAVKIIARREAKKLLPPNLIFRSYLFADYDSHLNVMGPQTRVGWQGFTTILPRVPIMDQQTLGVGALQPPVADNIVIDKFNPATVYGVNLIAPQATGKDGYRSGRKISIKNVSFGIRVTHDPYYENPLIYEHSFLKWAVVVTQNATQSAAGAKPVPSMVLRMKTFGYSSRLDQQIAQQTGHQKYRVLMRGTIKNTYSDTRCVQTQRTYHAKCNIPIEFAQNDMVGEQQTGINAMYLVVRSNIPDPLPNMQDYRPLVGAYYKLGYKNIT